MLKKLLFMQRNLWYKWYRTFPQDGNEHLI